MGVSSFSFFLSYLSSCVVRDSLLTDCSATCDVSYITATLLPLWLIHYVLRRLGLLLFLSQRCYIFLSLWDNNEHFYYKFSICKQEEEKCYFFMATADAFFFFFVLVLLKAVHCWPHNVEGKRHFILFSAEGTMHFFFCIVPLN